MILPNSVAFTVFGHNIYWYGVLIASAVLTAIVVCMKRAVKYNLTADSVLDIALLVVPAALIGARIYYVIFQWKDFASQPIRILFVWEGGLAIYGGIIGATVAAFFYCRIKNTPMLSLCDLVAPALAMGQAIGRWGNFVNQEAFGSLVTNPALQFFPLSVYIQADSSWHMATFFYEAAACFIISLFILWISPRVVRPGVPTLLYLLLYGIERSIVEGFRTDSLYLGSFRVSQVLSILLVIFSAVMLVLQWRATHTPKIEIDPNLIMRRHTGEDSDALSGEDSQSEKDGDVANAGKVAEDNADAERKVDEL